MKISDSFLEKLQNKPKKTRKKISLIGAAGITFFIFLIWLVSLPSRFGEQSYAEATPLTTLKANAVGAYETSKETLSDFGARFKNTAEFQKPEESQKNN